VSRDSRGYQLYFVMETSTNHVARFDGAVKLLKIAQALVSPRTLAKNSFTSNGDVNGWMITLTGAFLLLGFLLVWCLLGKNNLDPTNVLAASAETVQRPQLLPSSAPIHVDFRDWPTIREEMQRFVSEIRWAKEVIVQSSPNEIVISLNDTVPFDSGKAELRKEAMPLLQKVAAVVLNDNALSLEVSGHIDHAFLSSSKFRSNRELSTARASRVARYLIDNGFDSSRISVRGYAIQRRPAPNSAVDNRSTNQRVEIRLYRGVDQNPVR
jgi:outer membrane protein OmpA-like peptidoglycan-associated protein